MAGLGIALGGVAQGYEAGAKINQANAELGIKNRLADISQGELDVKKQAGQQALQKDMIDRASTSMTDAVAYWDKLVSQAPSKADPNLLQAGKILRTQIENTASGLALFPGGTAVGQAALKKFDAVSVGLQDAVTKGATTGLATGAEKIAAQPGTTQADIAAKTALGPVEARNAGLTTGATTTAELGAKSANLPAVTAISQATKTGEQTAMGGPVGQNTINNESKLRDDFNNSPVVKNYREATVAFNGIVDAAKRQTRASDLNMVYGIAKLMDPGSVVREGETVMVNNTQGLSQQLMGAIDSLNGGAKLEPATRKALLAEAQGRMAQHQSSYDSFKAQFTDIAKRGGMNPANVVVDVNAANVGAGAANAPQTFVNPTTGQRIQTLDGGKTWQPAP